jgi:Xaa-Pro aminopeptidase
VKVFTCRRGAEVVSSLLTVLLLAAQSAPRAAQVETGNRANSEAIRIAPPAPVFDDNERRAELSSRRARVSKELGEAGVLVLFSAEPRLYTGDADYEYRQENNLFYLTHLKQRGATLVLLPGNLPLREILFLPRRNSFTEGWSGRMYSAEEARAVSGVGEIWDSREFTPFMRALGKREFYRPKPDNILLSETNAAIASLATDTASSSASPARSSTSAPSQFETLFAASARGEAALYLLVPLRDADTGTFGNSREWGREQRFAEDWKKSSSGFRIHSAFPIFVEMRMRKSPAELRRMQYAIDVTTEAFGRAVAASARARREYELKAEVEYTFTMRGVTRGFAPIVGCGTNSTIVHYEEARGSLTPGELCLLDIGAEFDHYTADITRTFPVGGRFTAVQSDIYRVVLDAQEAGIKAVRPGTTLNLVHNAALDNLKDGLLRLGLITERNSTQYFIWFTHGTSHWLGMNAHDVGYGNTRLEPGMVLTVEPGIYIRPDALDNLPKTPEYEKFKAAVRPAFEKYKNIGVRIEDDILVTADGAQNLSINLPRTITEVESFVQRVGRTNP